MFFAIALTFRVYLPYDKVFGSDWIKFTGADAYYHMRLVDNLVHNFPRLLSFDPYLIYPGGGSVGSIRFFDWLLASITWVIGLGSPTERTIDIVGVYFPAVLGALTVIPVYFIGRELFGRWAGIFSAGLIAIMPGEFMGRSILGFTDHHVAETLFTTIAMLFLILAIKTAGQRQLTFNHIKRRDWTTSARPLIYSLLAGVFLGIYIFTFLGALLFVFLTFIFFVVQFIIDHLKGKSSDYLCLVSIIFFFVGLVASLLISLKGLYLVPLIIALLVPLALNGVSRLMVNKAIKPGYYPLTLVGLGVAGVAIFYIVNPSLVRTMIEQFAIFTPSGTQLTTIEMQPILFPQDNFSFQVVWGNFPGLFPLDPKNTGLTLRNIFSFMTTTFFLSLISLIIISYSAVKQGNAGKSLIVIWSLVMLAATLGQRRFGYYFAVNVSLLTGYLSWQLLKLHWENHPTARYLSIVFHVIMILYLVLYSNFQPLVVFFGALLLTAYVLWQLVKLVETRLVETPKKVPRENVRPEQSQKTGFHITISQINMPLALLFILLAIFSPIVLLPNPKSAPAIVTARQAPFAPNDGWLESLNWMKENTPEPFGDPALYYQTEEDHNYRSLFWLQRNVANPSGDPDFYTRLAETHKYPESAYGVMAWWDYGYWITRIAHRPPNANPSQDPAAITSVANFFISQDENSAREISQELNSSYIIIDFETATTKFWAIATWAGRDQTEYFDIYLKPQENQQFVPVQRFHPEYYRSLAIRLYNFNAKAVIPKSTTVISYQEMPSENGRIFKVITSEETFDNYQEAEDYLLSQESGNYKIVGEHPFISPVPLEALEDYRPIYSANSAIPLSSQEMIPSVKIFEYTGETNPRP